MYVACILGPKGEEKRPNDEEFYLQGDTRYGASEIAGVVAKQLRRLACAITLDASGLHHQAQDRITQRAQSKHYPPASLGQHLPREPAVSIVAHHSVNPPCHPMSPRRRYCSFMIHGRLQPRLLRTYVCSPNATTKCSVTLLQAPNFRNLLILDSKATRNTSPTIAVDGSSRGTVHQFLQLFHFHECAFGDLEYSTRCYTHGDVS
ncbi:hypothetical protein AB1N83_007639 [Pleurotus pulmonarius]